MKDLIRFKTGENSFVTVDLTDGSIEREDGNTRLNPQELRLLRGLVANYPEIYEFNNIASEVFETHDVWDALLTNRLGRRLTQIKTQLGFNVKWVKKIKERGYKLLLHFEAFEKYSLITRSVEDIFVEPQAYIEPEAWMKDLTDNAYRRNAFLHVISGERGIGKTELAKYFAYTCMNKEIVREELHFENVIFSSCTPHGLRETIAMLECRGVNKDEETYEYKCKLLERLKKPALLIIDNYDNEKLYQEELSETSPIYQDLKQTGCRILITSKINMSHVAQKRQTFLNPLSSDALINSFYELTGENENEALVKELIEKYLRNNTYLVRLVAGLTKTRELKEIFEAFQKLRTQEINDPLDGKEEGEHSLYEQYKLLFNMSTIKNNNEKCRLLYNLALLPISGMPYVNFFEDAFEKDNNDIYKKVFSELEKSYWVFLRDRTVSLHPLVKEIIISELKKQCFEDVSLYVDNINSRLRVETYKNFLPNLCQRGIAAFEVFEKQGVQNIDTICLVAGITGAYDIMGNHKASFYYGKKAFTRLDQVKWEDNPSRQYELAWAYNSLGDSLIHVANKKLENIITDDILCMVEKALLLSAQILEASSLTSDKAQILYTKNQGNLAGLQLTRKNYKAALDIHSSNCKYRQKRLLKNNTNENRRLVATAYKGMGTACYYLAKEMSNRREWLEKSYEYQSHAVKLYREIYSPDYHVDIAIAENRKTGTAILLMNELNTDDRMHLCQEIIYNMRAALQYLFSMEEINYIEVENSSKNVVQAIKNIPLQKSLDEEIVQEILLIVDMIKDCSPETALLLLEYVKTSCKDRL